MDCRSCIAATALALSPDGVNNQCDVQVITDALLNQTGLTVSSSHVCLLFTIGPTSDQIGYLMKRGIVLLRQTHISFDFCQPGQYHYDLFVEYASIKQFSSKIMSHLGEYNKIYH
jgi:hypothetical protein